MKTTIVKRAASTLFLSVCMLIVFSGCQPDQGNEQSITPTENESAATVPDGYPENPTGNIWSPDREESVPYYEIPAGWEANPSSKWHLRDNVPNQANSYLTLEYTENQESPLAARDAAYDKIVCINGENQNSFVDCAQTPQKSDALMAGQKVYLLTYWGTWRGKEEKVQLFYFLNDNNVYAARVEGTTSQAPAAVETIISSLSFRLEKFTPQNNPDDLGGI